MKNYIFVVFVVSIMVNCAFTQIMPMPLMNSIMTATPYYHQNAFDPSFVTYFIFLSVHKLLNKLNKQIFIRYY